MTTSYVKRSPDNSAGKHSAGNILIVAAVTRLRLLPTRNESNRIM